MEGLQEKGLQPTFESMNIYLDTAMRLDSRERIVDALKIFRKTSTHRQPTHTNTVTLEREPKRKFLRALGKSEDIPDEIYVLLNEFNLKFGYIRDKIRLLRPHGRHASR